MSESDGAAPAEEQETPPPRILAGDDERLEWSRIADACSDVIAASFPYEHRWMAWAVWIRAEERDPKPTQCIQGRCMCFEEVHAAREHWRVQRDDFQRRGVNPREGFAAPAKNGSCPAGAEMDDETLHQLFGADVVGSAGPIGLPGMHAILHLPGCVEGRRCAEDGARLHRWYVEPVLHRPTEGARFTTVTIDWAWSNANIAAAVARLRCLVGTEPEARASGAPFWNRWGAARAIALHDHRAAGGSVSKWAAEQAAARIGGDCEAERILAQKLLAKLDAAIDAASMGDLRTVLGW